MENLKQFPVKSPQTASRVVDGEAVVVLPMSSEINTLNAVGTRIWELADGSHSVSDIIDRIKYEFEIDTETVKRDTVSFISELITRNMVNLNDSPA